MTGPTPPVHPDDMPDGWQDAARAGWDANPAARAADLGRATYAAYAEVIRQWKVSIAEDMAPKLDVPVDMMVGSGLPVWDDLAPQIQDAWTQAAFAAREANQ